MKYIYTKDMCGACISQKKEWDKQNVMYEERSADRLSPLFIEKDNVDIEAFLQLQMQNQTLPVIVEL